MAALRQMPKEGADRRITLEPELSSLLSRTKQPLSATRKLPENGLL
jgi:hypothetical protein